MKYHSTSSQKRRKDIPTFIIDFCEKYGARNIFANIEYEVDELRRDIETLKLGMSKGYKAHFEHDKCIVEPGKLVTKQGNAYAVRHYNAEKKLLFMNNVPGLFALPTNLACYSQFQHIVSP